MALLLVFTIPTRTRGTPCPDESARSRNAGSATCLQSTIYLAKPTKQAYPRVAQTFAFDESRQDQALFLRAPLDMGKANVLPSHVDDLGKPIMALRAGSRPLA